MQGGGYNPAVIPTDARSGDSRASDDQSLAVNLALVWLCLALPSKTEPEGLSCLRTALRQIVATTVCQRRASSAVRTLNNVVMSNNKQQSQLRSAFQLGWTLVP